MAKIQLHQQAHTYVEVLNSVPADTKAVIVSLYCNFWNTAGHAYLTGNIQQKGNAAGGVAKFHHQHFKVYANTWYQEQMVSWDTGVSKELVVKVTSSYHTGGVNNWFRFKVVGYITA